MTNHAPGPWTVNGKTIKSVHHQRHYTVARVGNDLFTPGANEANARLIAAAPDLLAAVHGLLASCGPQHESETAEMYQERMTLLQWHIDRASEALTKATGE